MKIDFSKIESAEYQQLNDGNGSVWAKVFREGQNKTIIFRIPSGASIGKHEIKGCGEVNYVISGKGNAICDGNQESLLPGNAQYCRTGSFNSIENPEKEDLIILTVLSYPVESRESATEKAPNPSESKADRVIVYTDGGCSGNPGPGGWGTVIIVDGEARELSGGEKNTTNNRMELTAAISALTAIYNTDRLRNLPVEVYIDSQYVKNGITGWIKGWKKNGWLTSTKKPVLNKDLWEELDSVVSNLNVKWNWVKGHAGIQYNEVCDQLCQMEIKKHR